MRAWLRPYSPMEVVVTDQGSEPKGLLEPKVEEMSVFQQVTNTERPSGTMPQSRSSTSWSEKASNHRKRRRTMN